MSAPVTAAAAASVPCGIVLKSIIQSVLASLLVAAIGGGLVLWADMRTLRLSTLPALEHAIADLRTDLADQRAAAEASRKALEAHTVALAVLDARSQREARAQGREYQGIR